MLIKNNYAIELLKEGEQLELYKNIECWINKKQNFNIYIFSVVVENEQELNNIWEDMISDIAVYFQAELKKDIERWNIYSVFFVNGKVSKKLKYEIEHDMYSSRKIVFTDMKKLLMNRTIENIINKKLFDSDKMP